MNDVKKRARLCLSKRRYDGETYDSRLEQPGWSLPGYDATRVGLEAWAPAQAVGSGPAGLMSPWAAPPVTVTDTVKPVIITPHSPGGGGNNATCALDPEKQSASLTCGGSGNTISAVNFASYGQPTGSCADGHFTRDPKCDADITDLVTSLCKGKQTCTVECDNDSCNGQKLPGGDPCYLQAKHLAVDVSCASPPQPSNSSSSYIVDFGRNMACLLYTSPSPRDRG